MTYAGWNRGETAGRPDQEGQYVPPAAIGVSGAAADLSGNLEVDQFNGGTGADATKFWRGDMAWAVPLSVYSVVTKTVGYTETATSGELIIKADLAAGFIIVLPTAVGNTAKITVKKIQSAGQITIDGAGAETIDGGLTAVLNNLGEAVTLVSNNTGWDII